MKRVDTSIVIMLLVLSTALCRASAQDHGAVGGQVRNLRGIPQLGALVELLDSGSAVLARTYTDDHGQYLLQVPKPGRYQLRTSAALLLPALRRNLKVESGSRMLVNVTMSALFEAGDWFPVEKRIHREAADDWRWTLRSSAARPLLRLAGSTENERLDTPADTMSSAAEQQLENGPGTAQQHQELSILAGAGGLVQDGSQATWRTERKTATGDIISLQASANAHPGDYQSPAVLLGTGFSHQNSVMHGEYRVSAGFASLPQLEAGGGVGYQAATLATGERIVLGDLVTIDAGTLLSAERLVSSRVSTAPFLRLVVHPASDLAVLYRYAGSRQVQSLDDLAAVPITPAPLIDAGGRLIGQRATHQELAVSRATERNVTTLAVYRDVFVAGSIRGGGLLQAPQGNGFADFPILANSENGQFVTSLSGYTARGLSASWTHSLSAEIKATLEADFGTALTVHGSKVPELQALGTEVVTYTRPALTASVAGAVRKTATSFEVRYHWQPTATVTVVNAFDTPTNDAYAGLLVNQRLWRGRKLRSVSAVLEASNLLEEGYQPVVGPDGETLFLAQVPRALQAGLSFSF